MIEEGRRINPRFERWDINNTDIPLPVTEKHFKFTSKLVKK